MEMEQFCYGVIILIVSWKTPNIAINYVNKKSKLEFGIVLFW